MKRRLRTDPDAAPSAVPSPAAGRSRADEAGFTLVEMLIASLIMLTVTAGVFAMINPADGIFKAQPEAADMQQRIRVAVDALSHDLLRAGAGPYMGTLTGPLVDYLAPVLPYRIGAVGDDPAAGVFYRADAITVLSVPSTPSQTTIRDELGSLSALPVSVDVPPNCPPATSASLCGFDEGMRTLVLDASGAGDILTVAHADTAGLQLQRTGALQIAYPAGAAIAQVSTHTYYFKTNGSTGIGQLMHYDGYRSDLPLVDNIVSLRFQYFGDPKPPRLLADASLEDSEGPLTSYGPRPPQIGADHAADAWSAGENCVFAVQDGAHVPRLPVLADGVREVLLTPGDLVDGPWCPDETRPHRFDADLLRIRRVNVRLRVQAAVASLRGPAGVLFAHGGTARAAEGYLPDLEISFDIAPRNLHMRRAE